MSINNPQFLVSFPLQAMRAFIEANFKMMDINADGVIGIEEFRYTCIQRLAVADIKVVDDAFNLLLNVSIVYYLCCYVCP